MDFSGCGISVGNDDQGVDFEISELAVNVDGVEAGDEVHKDIVDTFGDTLQQSGGKLFIGWVFGEVDWDKDLLGLGIYIANVDTTLIGKENPVTLF